MRLPYFVVDAFTSRRFGGNPAGVCPLKEWLPDSLLQTIAMENNLSETAFFVPSGDGGFELRWFTPELEIDLCGHATLASAHVLFAELGHASDRVAFSSKSGPLGVVRADGRLELDFPSRPPVPGAVHPEVFPGLGAQPLETLTSRDYFCVFETEEQIRALKPDFGRLNRIDKIGVIATAPGRDCDFVSRFFCPNAGIAEDPVTGSAHSNLIPYWAARLGKTKLHARQLSARGGELFCELRGDRVGIGGEAVTYLRGEIEV